MEALRELEQKLNIRPLNFMKFKGETNTPPEPKKEEEKSEPKEVKKQKNFTVEKFNAVAKAWHVDVDKVINLYNQVKYYYETSKNAEVVHLCGLILNGLYYNNITRESVNNLIYKLTIKE